MQLIRQSTFSNLILWNYIFSIGYIILLWLDLRSILITIIISQFDIFNIHFYKLKLGKIHNP